MDSDNFDNDVWCFDECFKNSLFFWFWECAIKPNQKVARECNCNGQQCGKGKFCFKLNNKLGCYASGKCVDDGAHKVTQKCHCGDSPCPKGKYWFDGQCSATGNTPGNTMSYFTSVFCLYTIVCSTETRFSK